MATKAQGVDAAYLWKHCLQAGDLMAHFGLGYTLWEIGHYEEAHKHLETYTRLTPYNSWAWSWLGRACEALDDADGARSAYGRAIELEGAGAAETDASGLLSNLQRAGSPNEPVDPPPPEVGGRQASPTMKFVGDAPELREGVELVLADGVSRGGVVVFEDRGDGTVAIRNARPGDEDPVYYVHPESTPEELTFVQTSMQSLAEGRGDAVDSGEV